MNILDMRRTQATAVSLKNRWVYSFRINNQQKEDLRPFLSQTFATQVTQQTPFQAYWVDRINPQQLQEVIAGRIGTQPTRR